VRGIYLYADGDKPVEMIHFHGGPYAGRWGAFGSYRLDVRWMHSTGRWTVGRYIHQAVADCERTSRCFVWRWGKR
jgi:hypothetical protein